MLTRAFINRKRSLSGTLNQNRRQFEKSGRGEAEKSEIVGYSHFLTSRIADMRQVYVRCRVSLRLARRKLGGVNKSRWAPEAVGRGRQQWMGICGSGRGLGAVVGDRREMANFGESWQTTPMMAPPASGREVANFGGNWQRLTEACSAALTDEHTPPVLCRSSNMGY